ncbi:MAG: CBS domain-containing protein [Acidimicrobiia bacterium]
MATTNVARDIMTKDPKIMKVDDRVIDIAKCFAEENIGAVIICNDENRLQGMITDRDLAVEVLAQGKDPQSVTAGELVDGTEVVTIGADDSIDEAIDTMKDHAVRRLPVIDGDQVIGVVSQGDLALHADDTQVGRLVEVISAQPDNTGRG